MTPAAALAAAFPAERQETALDGARVGLELFAILFGEIFQESFVRYLPRAFHAAACAYLRGLEAIVRRLVMIRAALLAPGLPPAKPARVKAAKPETTGEPAPVAESAPDPLTEADARLRRASFCVLKVQSAGRRAASAPRRLPDPAARLAYAEAGGVMARYRALAAVLADAGPAALRLAGKVRDIQARKGLPQLDGFIRLHPDHEKYLARDHMRLTEDANEALRLLYPADPDDAGETQPDTS